MSGGIYTTNKFKTLESLSDVETDDLQNNQAPVYDSTLEIFTNKHVATSTSSISGNPGDVVIIDSAGSGITNTGVLVVDTVNNRVGINKVPSEDLDIDGNIQINTSGLGRLVFYDTNDSHEHAELDGDDDGADGGLLLLKTKVDGGSVSEKLRINNVGSLGIGGANYGTSGQYLVSSGGNAPITWADFQSPDADIDFPTGYDPETANTTETGSGSAYKGYAVAISGDGTTRASLNDVNDTIVVVKGGTTYTILWTITFTRPNTIKINNDGTLIVWGGSYDVNDRTVYYSTWTGSGYSTPTGLNLGDMAGTATRILTIDISKDLNTLVVGWANGFASPPFATTGFGISVYTFSGSTYTYRNGVGVKTGYGFGQSLAISDVNSGLNYIVVGEPYFPVSSFTNNGKIYIYSYDTTSHIIVELKTLQGNSGLDTNNAFFGQDRYLGWDVAISTDATKIAITAPGTLTGGNAGQVPTSSATTKSGLFLIERTDRDWASYNNSTDYKGVNYADPSVVGFGADQNDCGYHSVVMSPDGSSAITGHPWADSSTDANSGAFVSWSIGTGGNYSKVSSTIPLPSSTNNDAWFSGYVWYTGNGVGRGLDYNGTSVIIGSWNNGLNPPSGVLKIYDPAVSGITPPFTGVIESTKSLVVKDGLIYGFI